MIEASQICKPSLVVSSSLPVLLSFLVPDYAMVADDRGTIPRQGRRQGVRLQSGLTRPQGKRMSAKTTTQKPKRKKSRASQSPAYAASTISVATQNLINMVAVCAVSGTVLLGLLAVRHF